MVFEYTGNTNSLKRENIFWSTIIFNINVRIVFNLISTRENSNKHPDDFVDINKIYYIQSK